MNEFAGYAATHEETMRLYGRSLPEDHRRRYAALEALKIGFGGVAYVARGEIGDVPRNSPVLRRQPTPTTAATYAYAYAYDANGNTLSRHDRTAGQLSEFRYDPQDRLVAAQSGGEWRREVIDTAADQHGASAIATGLGAGLL